MARTRRNMYPRDDAANKSWWRTHIDRPPSPGQRFGVTAAWAGSLAIAAIASNLAGASAPTEWFAGGAAGAAVAGTAMGTLEQLDVNSKVAATTSLVAANLAFVAPAVINAAFESATTNTIPNLVAGFVGGSLAIVMQLCGGRHSRS